MTVTQQKTIQFNLNKLSNFYPHYFDVLSYKMEKMAKSYDISAYKKYKKELRDLDILNAKNILHIGCGSYPATAIALASTLDAKIVTLDKNPRVIEYAKNIIRKKNLEEKITIALGNAAEYPIKNFDVIIIGGACCDKRKVLYNIFETAESQTKIILNISIVYYKLIFQYITIPDNILIEKKIKSGWTFLDVLAGNYCKSLAKWLAISFIKK